jgi:DNA-binding XRE family transcriptional regulator
MQLQVAYIVKRENANWCTYSFLSVIMCSSNAKENHEMSFGQNLQFLRKMHDGMTQEKLAEKMGVSRQTISKWEIDSAFPEMETAIALCKLFSCSLDELLRENMNSGSDAYTNICVEELPPMQYVRYAVISGAPEDDAIKHVNDWAISCGIKQPEIIGWDFPFTSQEQINVYHMHGYAAACILPSDFDTTCADMEIITQAKQQYAVITVKEPFSAPFSLIPNAYKTLMRYMEVNGLQHKQTKEVLPCFEKVYEEDSVSFMDVYIAVEN